MGFVKKIAVYLTTALLLVATTNIVLSAHICAGELYSFSFYDNHTSCGCGDESSDQEGDTGHSGNFSWTGDNSCCSEISLETEKLDVVYPTYAEKLNTDQVAALQLINKDNFFPGFENLHKTAFKPYSLTPSVRDIPVLVQSFLL